MLDLKSLQNDLALVDLIARQNASTSMVLEQLIAKFEQLKIKMYQEAKHPRPHLHIDYGAQRHSATYALDNGERIIGTLHSKYDKPIETWIAQNRETLLMIWKSLQEGSANDTYIQELSGA